MTTLRPSLRSQSSYIPAIGIKIIGIILVSVSIGVVPRDGLKTIKSGRIS